MLKDKLQYLVIEYTTCEELVYAGMLKEDAEELFKDLNEKGKDVQLVKVIKDSQG